LKTADLHITLCLDPEQLLTAEHETSVFHPPWKTWQQFLKITDQNKMGTVSTINLSGPHSRFCNALALSHLERHFFTYPAMPYEGTAVGELEFISAANPRAEVEGVARKIRALCRDKSLRYRDITVILRDIETYGDTVAAIFSDYDIPFFIDQKRGVLHHPLTELIRSALEIIEDNWGYEAVFRYLKTDLTDVEREETDILENYILAHGIRGTRWTDERPWAYRLRYTLEEEIELSEQDNCRLERVNQIRHCVVQPLQDFADALAGDVTVKEITSALLNLLLSLNVPAKLEGWSQSAVKAGALITAREHHQIWTNITEFFDQIVESLGDQRVPLNQYQQILQDGLESLKIGLIPPGIDQVLVASLDRSRSPNVRAAFVLGVNEGTYPARVTDDALFSSFDRASLKEVGLELASGRDGRIMEEQYHVYTALTRSSEYLWLSYVLSDNDGKGANPSFIMRRLRDLFPNITMVSLPVEPDGTNDCEFVSHPRRTLSNLAGKLREAKGGANIDPVWWEVYQWAASDTANHEQVQRVISGLYHRNQDAQLSGELVSTLYGHPLRVSVSKIEAFRKCPFAHFAAFALRLKERHVHQLEAPSLGQFYHAALKKAGDILLQDGRSWGDLTKDEWHIVINQAVDAIVPYLQSEILLSSARYKYLVGKIRRIITRSALTLAEHDRRGHFKPISLELAFGPQGQLPAIELQLPNGQIVAVEGRIDRVDAAKSENGFYLRVIDYKMGNERLSLPEIFYGLRLQLVTYLHATLTYATELVGEPAKPAGILYFRIQEPLITSQEPLNDGALEQEIIKAMKMKGFIMADPNVAMLIDSANSQAGKQHSDLISVGKTGVLDLAQLDLLQHHTITLLASSSEAILHGVVDIKPYKMNDQKACTYCKYSSFCQFDELLTDNVYNQMHKVAPDLIWQKLVERGESGE